MLLHTAKDHAQDIGAKAIVAAIISRECLDAMESVFGEEAINVETRGDYASQVADQCKDKPTSAYLMLGF
jgi:hypothetical protein